MHTRKRTHTGISGLPLVVTQIAGCFLLFFCHACSVCIEYFERAHRTSIKMDFLIWVSFVEVIPFWLF